MTEKEMVSVELKFQQEKNEVLIEIAKLTAKINEIKSKIKKEEEKMKYVDMLFKKETIVQAGMLYQPYHPEYIKKLKSEEDMIQKLILSCQKELEKIEEKEHYIKEVYEKKIKELEKRKQEKESQEVREFKQVFSKRGAK